MGCPFRSLEIGADEQQAELGEEGGNNGENGEKCKHRISLAVAGGMFAVPISDLYEAPPLKPP